MTVALLTLRLLSNLGILSRPRDESGGGSEEAEATPPDPAEHAARIGTDG